jgi:hypothetical protein
MLASFFVVLLALDAVAAALLRRMESFLTSDVLPCVALVPAPALALALLERRFSFFSSRSRSQLPLLTGASRSSTTPARASRASRALRSSVDERDVVAVTCSNSTRGVRPHATYELLPAVVTGGVVVGEAFETAAGAATERSSPLVLGRRVSRRGRRVSSLLATLPLPLLPLLPLPAAVLLEPPVLAVLAAAAAAAAARSFSFSAARSAGVLRARRERERARRPKPPPPPPPPPPPLLLP